MNRPHYRTHNHRKTDCIHYPLNTTVPESMGASPPCTNFSTTYITQLPLLILLVIDTINNAIYWYIIISVVVLILFFTGIITFIIIIMNIIKSTVGFNVAVNITERDVKVTLKSDTDLKRSDVMWFVLFTLSLNSVILSFYKVFIKQLSLTTSANDTAGFNLHDNMDLTHEVKLNVCEASIIVPPAFHFLLAL